MITHIYFDWGGTLGKKGQKEEFIYGNSQKALLPGVKELLQTLTKQGFTLGIISNSSQNKDDFLVALRNSGLSPFFTGAIIFSSDPGMCKKPCKKIFDAAFNHDEILASNAIMIGDKYETDILGSKKAGFATQILV
jgi:HAD superfamily hydrolase (TIGR01662 family)